MFNKEKQSENNIFSLDNTKLNENCQKIVQDAVSELNIVGFMTGYYDENLTITQVSSHMLKNLGYTFEEFQKKTSGSLRNLFYGENQTFLEYDRFQRLQGCGEGQMLMSDGTPVFVRMCKKDAIADDGKQVWVLSVQIDWMQQNLKLINNVIHSAMWRFDCDKSGNIKEVYWSHEFRTMLGYHDILDFPNKLESWADLLHPEDKEATLTLLEQAIQDKTDSVKYDCEYRLKMKDGSYQWFRANAETTRRLDGTVRLIVGTFINIDKRKIRQKIGPDVSVIVLTSYDYTKIEEEAKAAGVDEFISKPLFRSRLTAALQKIISGKPSQDARDYLKNIAASDYTGKKILLVEDNELNREVAAEIIGMTGAEIETAVNGKEAVDKVADHPNGYYDLVFMDVQMPIMNGYEAATAIRSLPKHKGELLPIVAMTANAFTEDVILAKSAGMNEHIAKPLDMEKLNRMLHEWM